MYFEYISPSNAILSVGIFSLFLNLDKNFNKMHANTKKIIAEISSLIFGIYLLTTVVGQMFDRIRYTVPHTNLPVLFDVPLVALVIFVSTLSIVFLLSKIPYLKRIIS